MSRATAVRLCHPLLVAAVSQETEYSFVVSSAPRFRPSSLNCTPATVSDPMIVTLALTITVWVTVDPGFGEVMLTSRLPGFARGSPSCAYASNGRLQVTIRTANRTATRAYLIRLLPYLFFGGNQGNTGLPDWDLSRN